MEWIPISDRLPNAGGNYLVTVKGKYVKNYLVKCSYFSKGEFKEKNVVAWMNLPIPFKSNE